MTDCVVITVQLLSRVQPFLTPMDCSSTGSSVLQCLPVCSNSCSFESVMLSNHLILCLPLLLYPVFPSIRVFSNELALAIRWPKYWSFSISPSNECSGLISFRIDWFDLLAVQGTFKSLFQHHDLKASILQCPVFFMVQLTHPHMTTIWKNHCFDYMDICWQSDVLAF